MSDFDYKQLDDVIHSRIRLAIMSVLVSTLQIEFTLLREQVKATDGNLSVHLRKLEDSGYIKVHKNFENRKPVTSYTLTLKGHKAFEIYVERLKKLIEV
jgi:DNA-binding MarR family transcriptional regulator